MRSPVVALVLFLIPIPASAQTDPYLRMPETLDRPIPKLLSQTGAFSSTKDLTPAPGLIEYTVNVAFFSDGAEKRRWISLPKNTTITFSPTDHFTFPPGTVFVKHFELPGARRIETRLLVLSSGGGVYGVTYRWRPDNSDADLLPDSLIAPIPQSPSQSQAQSQSWCFPSPQDCRTCHTPTAGLVLGVTTRQLNRPFGPRNENQLLTWQLAGLFSPSTPPLEPARLPKLIAVADESQPIESRARSYLDANCANCHRPGGVAGNFDARFDTPLASQNLIDGPVLINLGIDHAKVIARADPWRSILLSRIETLEGTKMPPLGHLTLDHTGSSLLRQWIASLPARPVLAPPTIEPKGGDFTASATVTLHHPDPAVQLHYTLDGSLPTKSSPLYTTPIHLTDPTTLRARAFKQDATQSIAVQETFIVTP